MGNEYVTLKIPKNLVNQIDEVIGKHGFTSRAEFVKEAIRKLLYQYKEVSE